MSEGTPRDHWHARWTVVPSTRMEAWRGQKACRLAGMLSLVFSLGFDEVSYFAPPHISHCHALSPHTQKQ